MADPGIVEHRPGGGQQGLAVILAQRLGGTVDQDQMVGGDMEVGWLGQPQQGLVEVPGTVSQRPRGGQPAW